MKLEKSKNAKRNIFAGLVNNIVKIVLPFLIRTVTIKTIGTDYLGLSNLFTSILSVLSVTELGFSNAIVFNMYKAIANDDEETICSLLNYYKKVYRIIGLIILVAGLTIIPFLSSFIHGSYPDDINLTLLYLIYLINSVLSYSLFAYYSSLLNAFQRNDIISNINSILSISQYACQALILLVLKNYYLYVVMLPVFTIVNNLCSAYFARKLYPSYTCKGRLDKQILSDIKVKVGGMMITKLQAISRNSFDSIYISSFLGLTYSAIYSNYYFIMISIVGILYIIINSITAGVGNSIASESIEKNYLDMTKMNYIYMWISGWCTICLFCLYQPFMKLWLGDSMMFPNSVMILFCVYFYSLKLGDIRSVYLEGNGLWWENRYKAIFESLANLILNFVLGKYFGVYGILIATIITILVINYGYGSRIVFKHYFGMDLINDYYSKNTRYAVTTLIIAGITYLTCFLVPNNYVGFIVKGMICVVIPNLLYILFYRNSIEFSISIPWVIDLFHLKRIPFINSLYKYAKTKGE